MARLAIYGDVLALDLSFLEKVAALWPAPSSRVDQIESIEFSEDLWSSNLLQGVRAPGTGIPFVLMIGVMRSHKSKDFCVIKRKKPGVIITFSSGPFKRWIYTLEGSRHAEDEVLGGLGDFSKQ